MWGPATSLSPMAPPPSHMHLLRRQGGTFVRGRESAILSWKMNDKSAKSMRSLLVMDGLMKSQ